MNFKKIVDTSFKKENFWIGTLVTQIKDQTVDMTGIEIRQFIEICNTSKYETFYWHQSVELEFVG